MRKAIALMVVTVVLVIGVLYYAGGLNLFFPLPEDKPDTTTTSSEVAGFYGSGKFGGELLQNDTIQTGSTTRGQLSQPIIFQGAICQRVSGLGTVFQDGAKWTEPDVSYRVYLDGDLLFMKNLEIGSSTAILSECLNLTRGEYVIEGPMEGIIRVDLLVYVHEFARDMGTLAVLATDQALLSSAISPG